MPPESAPEPDPEDSDTEPEFVEVDPSGRYGRYKEVLGKGACKKVKNYNYTEMASAAVSSLARTIDHHHNSTHFSNINALNSSREIIRFAHDEVVSLKEVLLLFEDDVSIRKVFSIARSSKALEAFESHLSDQFPLQYRIVQFADRNLTPLQQFLQDNIVSKRVKVLDEQLIREAVCKLEDVIS